MKRILLLIVLLASATHCTNSPQSNPTESDGIKTSAVELLRSQHREELTEWDKLILAISYTESKFKTDAVGNSQDYGCLQITPSYCAEVNRISGANFKHEDAFDIDSSLAMFDAMQSHYNPDHDIDMAIYFHNKSASYKRVVLENLELIKRYETFRAKLTQQ